MSNDAPETARRPVGHQEILAAVDRALTDHLAWLRDWHAALLCEEPAVAGEAPPVPDHLGAFAAWYARHRHMKLVNQPAMQRLASLNADLRTRGEALMAVAVPGRPLPEAEYRRFMDVGAAFVHQARRLEKAFAQAASDLDPLTGLHNRQAMERDLMREWERIARTGRPCCVGLADIDRFKPVNDGHGHAAGDRVLGAVADLLVANVRPYDSVYRYGGEEFLICLPGAAPAVAAQVLERLRAIVEATPVALDDGATLAVTVSFGLAAMHAGTSVDETVDAADGALYRAKQAGRNRVERG